MAKAKKTESTEKASKSAAAKKTVKAKSPAPAGTPLVNTSFAAEAAAKMLASGFKSSSPAAPISGSKPESSLFKQLKANVAKPHVTGLENVLDQSAPADSKKSNVPFAGPGSGKQVGHNQTFGADVNRSGVPRRTAG